MCFMAERLEREQPPAAVMEGFALTMQDHGIESRFALRPS